MGRVLVALCLGALVGAPAALAQRGQLDIRLFSRVGAPGQPEPVAIGPDGNAYVGTNQLARGDRYAPSKIFVYSPAGELVREHVIEGQNLDEEHGIQGLAFDGRGLLYALDRAEHARVIVLDPATGRQADYATFRDVPPCSAAGRVDDCSATTLDAAAEPDYAAFGPDGSLYVTDVEQALVWRVPPGGGDPEVWYTDARFENIFGPNGIQVLDGGRTLLYAVTAQSPATGAPTSGAIYRQPVLPDGRPGEPELVWQSRPADGPDGIAVAQSGNVYVALAGASQVLVLSPAGDELARAPATPVENAMFEVPVDSPGSLAFVHEQLLMTNHSGIVGNPASWAILDVYAGEPGEPLFEPFGAAAARPSIRLLARPRRARAGRRQAFRFRVTYRLGDLTGPLAGARIRFVSRRAITGRRGQARLRVRLTRPGRRRAVARKPGYLPGRASVRVLPAGSDFLRGASRPAP